MSKSFLPLLNMFLFSGILFAQNCEDADRYLYPLSQNVQSTLIDYALVKVNNQDKVLRADVYYMPDDTVTNRPLIILAHGGAFVFGNKTEMRELCESYAKIGYVCASIEYRLYNFFLGLPDSVKIVETAFNAISDMRAAVRYFKANADRQNTFRIDPANIIAGGLSAGAIMALHVGILNEGDPLSHEFLELLNAKGGIEGNVGDSINQSYNSRVSAVLNLSGALFDLNWLDSEDPMILSMHGDADNVVPYGTAREGAFNVVTVNGSSKIHQRAEELNLNHYFVGVPGGGHTDIYSAPAFSSYYNEFILGSTIKNREQICGFSSNIKELPPMAVHIFPNPAEHLFYIDFPESMTGEYSVSDIYGTSIMSGRFFETNQIQINKGAHMSPGIYLLRIRSNQFKDLVSKIVFK
jgi:para-nitrobenzyl esterase